MARDHATPPEPKTRAVHEPSSNRSTTTADHPRHTAAAAQIVNKRAPYGSVGLLALQRMAGNHAVVEHLSAGRRDADIIRRAYIDLSGNSRLPENMDLGKKLTDLNQAGNDKELHIFAHSSGDNLQAIVDVAGKNPQAFAGWLVAGGRVFGPGDYDQRVKRSFSIYIHACASSQFAKAVKAALMTMNDLNSAITVYGTRGLSATAPDGNLVVIPLDHTREWLKFEDKLGKSKARDDELALWKTRYKGIGDGYDSF